MESWRFEVGTPQHASPPCLQLPPSPRSCRTSPSPSPMMSPHEGSIKKSVSDCNFTIKRGALVLPHSSSSTSSPRVSPTSDDPKGLLLQHRQHRRSSSTSSFTAFTVTECRPPKHPVLPDSQRAPDVSHDPRTKEATIRRHLRGMLLVLQPQDRLKMAVKLESQYPHRIRYLVVITHACTDEACLLGIDFRDSDGPTLGLVLPVFRDTQINLDGDGGFKVITGERRHIFKPVSVQTMWSALQTLNRVSDRARAANYFRGDLSHTWVCQYERSLNSDRSCRNEWDLMDDLEYRRPPSPESLRNKPTERAETEQRIRHKLKEIMMQVDLDDVTSKFIRSRIEAELDMDLFEFKSFIDETMLTILGQMDRATLVCGDWLYLGSEWNASNLEELQQTHTTHIMNVTREIDNFFPGLFDYMNVRVYDDEATEFLKHWDKTYRYISRVRESHNRVLVHCKMGVSRSASVVIAFLMKENDWTLEQALSYLKKKRPCVKPNSYFLEQLQIYQGILEASKKSHYWREIGADSVSESRRTTVSGRGQQSLETKSRSASSSLENTWRSGCGKKRIRLRSSTSSVIRRASSETFLYATADGESQGMECSSTASSPRMSQLRNANSKVPSRLDRSPSTRSKSWSLWSLWDDRNASSSTLSTSKFGHYTVPEGIPISSRTPPLEAGSGTESHERIEVLRSGGQAYSVSRNKAFHLDISPSVDSEALAQEAAQRVSADSRSLFPIKLSNVRRSASIKDRIYELEQKSASSMTAVKGSSAPSSVAPTPSEDVDPLMSTIQQLEADSSYPFDRDSIPVTIGTVRKHTERFEVRSIPAMMTSSSSSVSSRKTSTTSSSSSSARSHSSPLARMFSFRK